MSSRCDTDTDGSRNESDDRNGSGEGRSETLLDFNGTLSGLVLILLLFAVLLALITFIVTVAPPFLDAIPLDVILLLEVVLWLVLIGLSLLVIEKELLVVDEDRKAQYKQRIAVEYKDVKLYKRLLSCSDCLDANDQDVNASHVTTIQQSGGENARSDEPSGTYKHYLCCRLDAAEVRLKKAEDAVQCGNYASFLELYYAANRQQILVYPYIDVLERDLPFHVSIWTGRVINAERRQGESYAYNLAKLIHSVAQELPENKQKLVEEYVTNDKKLKSSPGSVELYNAVRVLHDQNVKQFRQAMDIKRFLRKANRLLGLTLFAFAIIVVAFGMIGDFAPEGVPWWFLFLVPLIGAIGALFSSLFPVSEQFYAETKDPKVPKPEIIDEAMVARLLVGAVSGIVLFGLLVAGLVDGILDDDALTPALLLVVAFLGGFSERILQRSLDKIESQEAE